jgi:hypothetical protein
MSERGGVSLSDFVTCERGGVSLSDFVTCERGGVSLSDFVKCEGGAARGCGRDKQHKPATTPC